MSQESSPKHEYEYEKIRKVWKKDHRYSGREEEVVVRNVNNQRKQAHETKAKYFARDF